MTHYPVGMQPQPMPSSSAAPLSSATRHARRVYVGNLPAGANEIELKDFIIETFAQLGGLREPGDPVVSRVFNMEKRYMFLELRSVEETSAMLQLDGLLYKTSRLKFRRPADYDKLPAVGGMAPKLMPHSLGIVATNVEEGPNKIYFGGFPVDWSEIDAMKVIQSQARLRSFYLLREKEDGPTKGYGFGQFLNPAETDAAIQLLNNHYLATDKRLKVQRCNGGSNHPMINHHATSAATSSTTLPQAAAYASTTPVAMATAVPVPPVAHYEKVSLPPLSPSQREEWRQLLGRGMGGSCTLTSNKLFGDEELKGADFWDMFQDVKQELQKLGKVKRLVIPRPQGPTVRTTGTGRIFVQFEDPRPALAALKLISGRKYNGHIIHLDFYDEVKFNRNEFL